MKLDKQLYDKIVQYVTTEKTVSAPIVQARFDVGYITARSIIAKLVSDKYVEYKGGVEYVFTDPLDDPKLKELRAKILELDDEEERNDKFDQGLRACAERGVANNDAMHEAGALFMQASKLLGLYEKLGLCSARDDSGNRTMYVSVAQIDYLLAPYGTYPEDNDGDEIPEADDDIDPDDAEINRAFEQTLNELAAQPSIDEIAKDMKEQSESGDSPNGDNAKAASDDKVEHASSETATQSVEESADGDNSEESGDADDDYNTESEKEPPLWTLEDRDRALNTYIDGLIKEEVGRDYYTTLDIAKYRADESEMFGGVIERQFKTAALKKIEEFSLGEYNELRARALGYKYYNGYKFDVVFAIDTSNGGKIANMFAYQASMIDRKLNAAIEDAGCTFDMLRLKTVFFDGKTVTDGRFYEMPRERDLFIEQLRSCAPSAHSGPSNALEALYAAMRSDFAEVKFGDRSRRKIVLLSEAYPLSLAEIGNPDNLRDVHDLERVWESDENRATALFGRLHLIVPSGSDENGRSWKAIADWYRTSALFADGETRFGEQIDVDTVIAEILRS